MLPDAGPGDTGAARVFIFPVRIVKIFHICPVDREGAESRDRTFGKVKSVECISDQEMFHKGFDIQNVKCDHPGPPA